MQAQLLDEIRLKKLNSIHHKGTPYLSTQGVPGVELNCKVSVPIAESESGDREDVACRHFAIAFAQYSGKKSQLMEEFSTEDRIEEIFDGKLIEADIAFESAISEAPRGSKHLVGDYELGRYLTCLAQALNAAHERGPSEANCLLLTARHAMALHVERKSKAGVDYFAAKLFDPNDTATYKRVEKLTPEGLSSLTLDDLLVSQASSLASDGSGSREPRCVAAVCLDDALRPSMGRFVLAPTPGSMGVALSYGVVDAVCDMLEDLARDPFPPSREKVELWRAKCRDGFPGLYVACQNGHTETVKVYTESVLACKGLGDQGKADLLSAKTDRGTPGLHIAFQFGHTGVVKAFTDRVLAWKDFDENTKLSLLTTEMSDGVPGLHTALQNGHAETVAAFTESILSCKDLSDSAKFRLLAAQCSDGFAGLYAAMQNDHTETVKAFTERILACKDFDENTKLDLLAAKTNDGFAGLYVAFHRGYSETVKAFTESVLASKNIGAITKVHLLAAKTSAGVSGLFAALATHHVTTARQFAWPVSRSDLSDEHKAELLAPGLLS